MSKKFMYGIGAVKFKGKKLGYIEKNSWNNQPQKPEVAEVNAEQIPGAPVLVIPQSNGSFRPTFNLIQLDYENMAAAQGGDVAYDADKKTAIGWEAPDQVIELSGPWAIELVSGQTILIANGTLLSALGGQLTLTETAKIECELRMAQPTDGSKKPYAVYDSDKIPPQWRKRCLIDEITEGDVEMVDALSDQPEEGGHA